MPRKTWLTPPSVCECVHEWLNVECSRLMYHSLLLNSCTLVLSHLGLPGFCLQYSQKEDKYEEEIKVLTDKLKEASFKLGF